MNNAMCGISRTTFTTFTGIQCPCKVGDDLPFAKFNQNSKLMEAKWEKYHTDLDTVSPKIIPIFTLRR